MYTYGVLLEFGFCIVGFCERVHIWTERYDGIVCRLVFLSEELFQHEGRLFLSRAVGAVHCGYTVGDQLRSGLKRVFIYLEVVVK